MRLLIASLMLMALVSGCTEKPTDSAGNATFPEYSHVVDLAKSDLAERLNISLSQIEVVKQEKVDWPDTGLGYPEKGKMYAQVITPGYRIVLRAEGRLYEYHSDYRRVVGPVDVSNS